MKNVIYFEPDLDAVLLKNEEQVGNSIILNITTDDAADQRLVVTKGETAQPDIELESDAENVVILPNMAWQLGGTTTVQLFKGEDEEPTAQIVIEFPDILDTDSTLSGSAGFYRMQGSANFQQQIISLQEQISNISSQVVDYIKPTSIDQTPIADGDNHDIMTFEFYSSTEGEISSFYSLLNYEVETSVGTGDIYGDCTIIFTFTLDGTQKATIMISGGDCYKETMLNFLLENLSKGNHTFVVNMAVSGGSIS